MSVLYRQNIAAAPSLALRRTYHGFCPAVLSGGCLPWCRKLRPHSPELSDLLEDLYDRVAESCDRFVNISEVDKYSITCTVCRNFDAGGCISPGAAAVDIIALLQGARRHDSL